MFILFLILTVLILLILVLVAAVDPGRSQLSLFELERRAAEGHEGAKKALERQKLLGSIISLQKVVVALLLVVVVLVSNLTFGWLIGVLVAVFVALEYGAISQIGFIKKLAKRIYEKIDERLIRFIKRAPLLIKILNNVPNEEGEYRIGSRQELQHLIDESGEVLNLDDKKLIVAGLSFGDKLVKTIMTPKSMISSISSDEFLGPLALDDLHKIGHSRLPVIKGDIDHIVGMLNLRSLLALDIKKSTTAEKAMDPKVFYIHENQTLRHALTAFLKTRHHLFVVVNEFRETVGLLSLEDVIEELIGQEIVDEFDSHDNLRAVALRNPKRNNITENHKDI
jgi:CBS domain containing-hemolysin-like protein